MHQTWRAVACFSLLLFLLAGTSFTTTTSAQTADPRLFPQTGYRVDFDAFWDFFQKRGGVNTFGYPIGRDFLFLGCRAQFFQRLVMQECNDQGVGTLNLLDTGLLPAIHLNGSTFPGPNPTLQSQAPHPDDPGYLDEVTQFIHATAPDTFDGHAVRFGQTFGTTVSAADALPDADPSSPDTARLLMGFDLQTGRGCRSRSRRTQEPLR